MESDYGSSEDDDINFVPKTAPSKETTKKVSTLSPIDWVGITLNQPNNCIFRGFKKGFQIITNLSCNS